MTSKTPLAAVLTAILLLSALATTTLCIQYVRNLGQVQRLQFQVQRLQSVNFHRAVVQSLVNECFEYSRKNPSMGVLLQPFAPLFDQLNLKSPSATSLSTRPSTRQP